MGRVAETGTVKRGAALVAAMVLLLGAGAGLDPLLEAYLRSTVGKA